MILLVEIERFKQLWQQQRRHSFGQIQSRYGLMILEEFQERGHISKYEIEQIDYENEARVCKIRQEETK